MHSDSERIARNAFFLYVRMAVIMLVTLFTSRVVLESLGIDDFGIYNLVGGISTFLGIISGIMSDATQRFISFEIGQGTPGGVGRVFSTSILLHIIIAIITVLIAEPFGMWLLENKLMIPEARMDAAFWVFQISLISFFVTIVTTPFNALIISYERMDVFAYISVIDAVLRLAIAASVKYSANDKLIVYAILMAVCQVCICAFYFIYCSLKLSFVKFKFATDMSLIKEMGAFAGWTIFGNASFLCYTQGINLLLGSFFAPVVSAARGISVQVQGAASSFVRNFQLAVNPPITKCYAAGHYSEMYSLLYSSSRVSYYLLVVLLIPLIFETEEILQLWLNDVPRYSADFIRVMLISQLFITLRNPIEMSIKSSGNIKLFEICVSSLGLMSVPLAYVFLKLGCDAVSVFEVLLFLDALSLLLSYVVAKKIIGFDIRKYCLQVLAKVILVTVLILIAPLIAFLTLESGLLRLMLQIFVSVPLAVLIIFMFGLTSQERDFVRKFFRRPQNG